MKWRPKIQIGMVIVSYAILGLRTSFFPVLRRYHKRELQEQGTEHAFEAHTICRRYLLLMLSVAEAFHFTLTRGSQPFILLALQSRIVLFFGLLPLGYRL